MTPRSLALLVVLIGCSSSEDPATSSGSTTPPPSNGGNEPTPPLVEGADCDSSDFEVRSIGTVQFEGETFEVITATPCAYVLSHIQGKKDFPVEERETFYVVDSQFELPYIPGVMDNVAYTPGDKNKGWANGMDVEAEVARLGALPVLYHVTPGHEYGYFTDHNDGGGDIFGAFRPTWRFIKNGSDVSLRFFSPPDTAWPRHRGGWNPREINQEIGFGLLVDTDGKVYIPKGVPLGRTWWNEELRCVLINKASQPVPVTRTQFPGDESYYMAETVMPGYASLSSHGHLYWGHKGKPMVDVAKWDDTLPGNFDKPFGGGCSPDGYSVAHAEGFTWPELRAQKRDQYLAGEIEAIPKEHLYRIKVYRQNDPSGAVELLGELFYEWDGDEWLPKATGDALIPIDPARSTYRISGHLGEGQRAFVVIEDL
ncbi:hypothetical protein [Chondromyces crocatus]|uniref:Uncharacterized protein n=1 Tax=Chondromyces crocatus TaxID=52 RepID=A0A0K1E6F8_CHOCO|nr:hypothetical protein [Chondromyces crocatus]AKT36460.1 uncharacterized protein CMC5_005750 [Chondromyces crocatus]